MKSSVIVLGAGMVGTCTALHLALRGHDVTLIDRREPGRETSFGNAGLIQREAVEPYPFPQDWAMLARVALRQGAAVHYHLRALPRLGRE
jgi:D-amino-acid dehydrogenase